MKFTDEEILFGIRSKDNSLIFKYLYESLYKPVFKMVLSYGGTKEDVKDTLQNALVIFWENVMKDKYKKKDNTKISTYIYSICKYQWLKHMNQYKREFNKENFTDKDYSQNYNDDIEEKEKKQNLIFEITRKINELNEKCKRLITLYYYYKKSMKDIAVIMKFSNERSAITQKYKCMKRLISLVKN